MDVLSSRYKIKSMTNRQISNWRTNISEISKVMVVYETTASNSALESNGIIEGIVQRLSKWGNSVILTLFYNMYDNEFRQNM